MIKTFWLAAIAFQATTDALKLSANDIQADALKITKKLVTLAIQVEDQVKTGGCEDPYPKP